MKPSDLGRSYDTIADRWASETFNRNNAIAQHERALAFLAEGRGKVALDIGCGSSGRLIDLLLSRGFEVEGLDVSGRMMELAKERHPDVVFHHADICEWEFQREYDFITAWDSIFHLPLEQQEPVMRKICDGLSTGGVFVFTTGGVDGPESKSDSAMGPEVGYSALGIPRTLEVIAEAGCICRHLEYDQYPELHVYIVAQRTSRSS